MERLTSKIKYKDGRRLKKNWEATTFEGADAIYEASQKLAEYKDAKEQGLLIKLPCKVGESLYWFLTDVIYGTKTIYQVTVQSFVWWYTNGMCVKIANMKFGITCRDIPLSEIGKTLFLTKEAAEAALKEGVSE